MTTSFESTSEKKPGRLIVSFESYPNANLGVKLHNADKTGDADLFTPSYAVIKALRGEETLASQSGVAIGDCIVAVNDVGYRRLAASDDSDFIILENPLQEKIEEEQATKLKNKQNEKDKNGPFKFNMKKKKKENTSNYTLPNHSRKIEPEPQLEINRVIHGKPGDNYTALLSQIRDGRQGGKHTITLERYGWDHRVHSWARFLRARNEMVPQATAMLQQHEVWKERTFPIDLSSKGIKKVFSSNAITELDFTSSGIFPPTVYVNFGKLTALDGCTPQNVVDAFVVVTETLLAKAVSPRHPKTCQFIDMTNAKISSSFKVAILKKIYSVFEPNYPETLHKMVLYPVSRVVRKTSNLLLSFVNEDTRRKFVLTDDLNVLCKELGFDKAEIGKCGGVSKFVEMHGNNSCLV